MSDDEIIGIKSTSIKFRNNIKIFTTISYIISTTLILFLFSKNINFNLFSFFLCFFILSLFYQILKFDITKPKTCLAAFKLNNISGFFLFLSITFINF